MKQKKDRRAYYRRHTEHYFETCVLAAAIPPFLFVLLSLLSKGKQGIWVPLRQFLRDPPIIAHYSIAILAFPGVALQSLRCRCCSVSLTLVISLQDPPCRHVYAPCAMIDC